MAWLEARRGNDDAARGQPPRGRAAPTDYCFPARLEEIGVLETAELLDPTDPRAPYYLGNLLYDRRRYDDAIRAWRRAAANDPGFSIVQRNLGIAEYNVRHRPVAARAAYVRARRAPPTTPASSTSSTSCANASARTRPRAWPRSIASPGSSLPATT